MSFKIKKSSEENPLSSKNILFRGGSSTTKVFCILNNSWLKKQKLLNIFPKKTYKLLSLFSFVKLLSEAIRYLYVE